MKQRRRMQPARAKKTAALIIIGVLGRFTTFSSFSNETVDLWRGGQGVLALSNVTAQVMLGLGAVLLGHRIGLAWWAN